MIYVDNKITLKKIIHEFILSWTNVYGMHKNVIHKISA